MKPEYIRTSLKRMWLEEFFNFSDQSINSTSKDIVIDLLRFEADFKTI